MSENKKLIVFFSWVTFACLVLTYLFSIIEFSFSFLNNNFLLIVFGGLFASMGVMLLAEIRKYFLNKRTAEDQLHFDLFSLYKLVSLEKKYAIFYQSRPNSTVPENLFHTVTPDIERYINSVSNIDYNLIKANPFSRHLREFREKELWPLHINVILSQNSFSIAINNAKIRVIKQGGLSYNPVSNDPEISRVLCIIKETATERLEAICKIQDALSSYCKNRYAWEKEKAFLDAIEINIPDSNQ